MGRLADTLRRAQTRSYRDPSLSDAIAPYGHRYPWQLYSKLRGVQLTARLPQTFAVAQLQAELAAVLESQTFLDQFGPYHYGGWNAVALNAVDGDPLNQDDPFDASFQKTAALKHAPLMEQIMDSLPGEKRRVRLMRLEPGKKIFWHRDHWHSYDLRLLRLHIPIVTHADVGFQISHTDCRWQPGELWYGDFTFPHRLQNGGDTARVHLVIDIINNDALRALLPDNLRTQTPLRITARYHCTKLLHAWHKLFATGQRLSEARETRLRS
ncbi:MAG: aspartyl/asparaginyl beta-hydroxylase domain-containing protein [Gammaproteobacteria bacterium]|jgi:hypothetical protein|nr:aspartyl/asparaginyl beta-hydroxylase domain-containing protein [Gammaproteobacteria bacterium]